MRRRGRMWRVAMWAGTLTCLLVLAAWLMSIQMTGSIGRGFIVLFVGRGQIVVRHYEVRGKPAAVTQPEASLRKVTDHRWTPVPRQWDWTDLMSYGFVLPTFSRQKPPLPPSSANNPPPFQLIVTTVVLPWWFLFVLAAIPTGLAWRFDRRRYRTGHCQRCGYDLTGNLSGRCPECGKNV